METSYNKIQHQDPIGQAILEYANGCNHDTITAYYQDPFTSPVIVLVNEYFRSEKEMHELELCALKLCRGNVLDVGAGAGIHCTLLQKKGLNVFAIDASLGATKHLNNMNIPAENILFENFQPIDKFDTILMLWNGIGITGTLGQLKATLLHAKTLLKPGGQLLCDSSDIRHLYESNELLLNLNEDFYGDIRVRYQYKQIVGDWFHWLFIDYDRLQSIATELGFSCNQILEHDHRFLAQLIID